LFFVTAPLDIKLLSGINQSRALFDTIAVLFYQRGTLTEGWLKQMIGIDGLRANALGPTAYR